MHEFGRRRNAARPLAFAMVRSGAATAIQCASPPRCAISEQACRVDRRIRHKVRRVTEHTEQQRTALRAQRIQFLLSDLCASTISVLNNLRAASTCLPTAHIILVTRSPTSGPHWFIAPPGPSCAVPTPRASALIRVHPCASVVEISCFLVPPHHKAREAKAAPSANAPSFAQAISGWIRPPSPQSVDAITRSRPTTPANRKIRSATNSGCSTTLVA